MFKFLAGIAALLIVLGTIALGIQPVNKVPELLGYLALFLGSLILGIVAAEADRRK